MRTLDAAIAAACLVAVAAAWWVTEQTNAVVANRTAIERQLGATHKANDAAKARSAAVEKDVADVKAQIAALRPPSPPPRPPSPSQQVRMKTAEIIRQNPELMAAARESQKRRIDATYDALFRQLHLSAEQIKAFEAILAAESGLVTNTYAIEPPTDDAGEVAAEKLQALLGGSYDAYVRYRESLTARSQVERFAAEVANVEPLSAVATQRMLDLYAAGNAKQLASLRAAGTGGGYESSAVDEDVLPAARSVLTPRQLEVLRLMVERDTGREIATP